MSFFKAHYTYNPNGDKYKFDQLLFVRDSEFLRCYCAEFVKGKMAPECNTNARLLVEYFNVHGKLLDLMKEVAKREIETTNSETQVFRGNTSFTRLYGEYCHLCLLPYLRAVTKEVIQLLINEETKLDPEALNSPELENHKESMDTFCKLAHMFGTKLVDCVHLLPSHFHQLLRFISVEVGNKKSVKSTPQNTFNLLFFIRTVFPVFHAPQHVMDTIQPPSPEMAKRLTAFSKTCQSLLNETTTSSSIPLDIANFMTSSASKLFEMFTHPRSGYMTEKSGLDFSLQANAHKNIVELVRSNIEPLTALMTRDVQALKDALKSEKNEDSVMTEMQQSLEFCSNTYSERLQAVEDEITDLNDEIEKYKAQLKAVQKAIEDEDELTAKLQEEINRLENESSKANTPTASPRSSTRDSNSDAALREHSSEDI
ncbi:hypothetical protein EDI_138730 [Entamoeba dispar SAW760]|uniref:Ras-GAP domain-containing protein n=1 Tax=Entamoeba dispar (strain ATCC PRA-260 / SAW760) TaxID=370354 RepID=B0EIG6_ENTDS|nr:uncharacterized protein EDI_138730 [Entamoeba dispar SAW760]EDR25695.1 hypothetical protein EDI_138730 [Entamoeba dispar SAW760]|eukprot:EDR25695.1 hypothetical protein EDI_138730 [Entamoeba dispar SAW760]